MQALARFAALVLCALLGAAAGAASVGVVGLFPGKAVVSINGGAPRTLGVGQKTAEGVALIAASGDSATFDIGGLRRVLRMGEMAGTAGAPAAAVPAASAASAAGGDGTATLAGDGKGHYMTVGAINDRAVKFVVDTGASTVWMSSTLAERIGLDYRRGQPFTVQTAGGPKAAFGVMLGRVRVGGITLENVEGAVGEGPGTGDTVLLGMSFLSRLSMNRDGATLRLSRRDSRAGAADTRPQVTLKETRGGMFAASASINGAAVAFLVDTGATMISIDAATARRIGINYQNGTPSVASTANGLVRTWLVKFDSVQLGPIALYNVDGSVSEGPGIGIGLLGMSFLNRVEIRRDGDSMTLIKRF